MKSKSRTLSLILILFSITALGVPAFGAAGHGKVKIPTKAISPRTMTVIYINRDKLAPKQIKATAHVFTDAIPDSNKKLAKSINDAIESQLKKQEKQRTIAKKGHVHAICFIMTPAKNSANGSGNKSNSKSSKQKGKIHGSKVILFKGDDSTTPEGIIAAIKQIKALKKLQGKPGIKYNKKPKISRFIGNWFIAKWPKLSTKNKANITYDVPKDAGDQKAATRFNSLLNSKKNTSLRVAFVPNQMFRKNMAGLAQLSKMIADTKNLSSDSIPMDKIYGALAHLKYALITGKLGNNPSLNITLNFTDNKAVKQGKNAVKQILAPMQQKISKKLSKLKDPPSTKLIETVFNELQPTAQGSVLTLNLNKQFLQNLAKLTPLAKSLLEKVKANQDKNAKKNSDNM